MHDAGESVLNDRQWDDVLECTGRAFWLTCHRNSVERQYLSDANVPEKLGEENNPRPTASPNART